MLYPEQTVDVLHHCQSTTLVSYHDLDYGVRLVVVGSWPETAAASR